VLPDAAEDGLFRLLLRWRDAQGGIAGWSALTGPGTGFAPAGPSGAGWHTTTSAGLSAWATLRIHPQLAAWCWRVRVTNTGATAQTVDVLHAQDLGLADEGAVRNNEAYVSQYLDLLPVRDAALGWTLFARQNQPAAGGRHPWAAFACADGAAAYCTDGWQFFGADHRLTGEPVAVRTPDLPSVRLQYEFGLAGLQSGTKPVAPGQSVEFAFVGRFLEDHPTASAPADLSSLREVLPAE
jgi:CRISPR-associated protein Csx3